MKRLDEINDGKISAFPTWIYLLICFSIITLAVTLALILARIVLFVFMILLIVLIALYLLGPMLDIKIEILDDLRTLVKKARRN